MPTSIQLDTPVQFVRGVGAARARALAACGITTVGDLIQHYPARYEFRPPSQAIGSLVLDQTATVVGEIRTVRTRGCGRDTTVTATVEEGTGRCQVRWYHSPHLADQFRPGQVIRLTGKVGAYQDQATFANPVFQIINVDDGDPLANDAAMFEPVYPASASLTSRQIARIIRGVLPVVADQIVETLPADLCKRRRLPPRRAAIERYHLPTKAEDIEIARQRLAYDELLTMQLAVQLKRYHAVTSQRTLPLRVTDEVDRRIRARLPFRLTPGQESAVADIVQDLARDRPMCRLLQADVGAGKTAVALYAALAAIANRRQAAILAPTEVLAHQHHRKVAAYLADSRVRIGYVVGGLPRGERQALDQAIADGRIDLIVGTHALLSESVRFASLALVVVDEQHRFGVTQRAAIRHKGRVPHYLVLTATPIPRTLAMTVFGDLDVSIIRDAPPGRGGITTRLVRPEQASQAWAFVRQRLGDGQRAFVICPLVTESETLPLKGATSELERLRGGELRGFALGLLHGRMPPAEKDRAMNEFRRGKLDVLVATTVVEVGVDVPEATVMVIQHAERYGLSQLHQLRGRVGRGPTPSYCLLMADPTTPEAHQRLETLVRSNDGFHIAEEDLRLRGPGELLGTQQHGLPAFKVARLVEDLGLLEAARDDAAGIIRADPRLERADHRPLREAILARFRDSLALADVA